MRNAISGENINLQVSRNTEIISNQNKFLEQPKSDENTAEKAKLEAAELLNEIKIENKAENNSAAENKKNEQQKSIGKTEELQSDSIRIPINKIVSYK